MVGNSKNIHYKKGNTILIGIVVVISLIILFLAGGAAAGMTLLTIKNRTGELNPTATAFACQSSTCFLNDENFKDPVTGLDATSARNKLNIPSSVPDEKIQKVIDTVRNAGYNPALVLATWKKESSYGTDPENKKDSNGRYELGYIKGGWGGIDKQLEGYLKTMNWAYNNQDPYGDRPDGKPIQVHWIDTYTPSDDPRNNVPEDRKILCSVLSALVPDQITQSGEVGSCFGAAISGQFYPPYGDKMNAIISLNKTAHVGKGHNPFKTSPFGDSFNSVSNDAIDLNTPKDALFGVYSAFDGKVIDAIEKHKSNYGVFSDNTERDDGAGILWVKSSDGNNGAIYAHIQFEPGITSGSSVKRGQLIGKVAKSCQSGGNDNNQCHDFRGADHLHFQFYPNKKGLNFYQLKQFFSITTK